ncbi:MAG: MBL fold metallo-hydrolase, partial [Candidatus Zixiibacteriota bacterium]
MPPKIHSIRVGINRCYLVKDDGAILIDAGPPGKINTFRKAFEKFSINPHEIKLIILTHGDLDHAGSAEDLKRLTGAKIAIHRADQQLFEQSLFNFPPGVTAWGKSMHAILSPLLKRILHGAPGAEADIVLSDDDYPLTEYGIRGKIIHTPGHTSGSVSVLLDTGDAFVGCMAHNSPP